MRCIRLWNWMLAGIAALTILLPLSARAADNGGWDDDWAYFDREDAFAYPEPAPSPKPDNVCLSGVNHHDSPCDCPPIKPVEYPGLPDEPMVCEHPFGDDEDFLEEFGESMESKWDFSENLPILRQQANCKPKCGICNAEFDNANARAVHLAQKKTCGCTRCLAPDPHTLNWSGQYANDAQAALAALLNNPDLAPGTRQMINNFMGSDATMSVGTYAAGSGTDNKTGNVTIDWVTSGAGPETLLTGNQSQLVHEMSNSTLVTNGQFGTWSTTATHHFYGSNATPTVAQAYVGTLYATLQTEQESSAHAAGVLGASISGTTIDYPGGNVVPDDFVGYCDQNGLDVSVDGDTVTLTFP